MLLNMFTTESESFKTSGASRDPEMSIKSGLVSFSRNLPRFNMIKSTPMATMTRSLWIKFKRFMSFIISVSLVASITPQSNKNPNLVPSSTHNI